MRYFVFQSSGKFRLLLAAVLAIGATTCAQAESARGKPAAIDFNREIRPILTENCFKCHGPDPGARKAGLRFDVRAEALKPVKSGAVPIVPGAPEKSAMVARITASDSQKRMPPAQTGKKLSSTQ